MVIETEIAWELATIAGRRLNNRERDKVYIAITAGESFWAIGFLLRTTVGLGLAVRPELVSTLLKWVVAYRDHPEESDILMLIRRLTIRPGDLPRVATVPRFLATTTRYTRP